MKIVHICSDFAKQSIYNQLITHLASDSEMQEIVYVPTRTVEELEKNKNQSLQNVVYHFEHILNKSDRLLYFSKIKKVSNSFIQKINLNEVDLIHAHFLFSDGGVALNCKKKYGIPYIVAVRNTDLNMYFKYMLHLRSKGIEILQQASKIIFLSDAYNKQLLDTYIPKALREEISNKSLVIPNGIDAFWLNNKWKQTACSSREMKVIYVGDFSKNKNIQNTILALRLIAKDGIRVTFSVVGGGGDYHDQIMKLIKENNQWIRYYPRTNDKNELLQLYRNADIFCMPSRYETFGLVYIEAMTQGLPVIYSKGQGIDGYFKDGEVGYSVDSSSVLDIKDKLLAAHKNQQSISTNCFIFASNFSWEKISKTYIDLYKSTIEHE